MSIVEENAVLDVVPSVDQETIEHVREHASNFFDLSESEKEHLSRRIEACAGEVEIFIHPFFTEHDEKRQSESSRLKDYEKDFPDRSIDDVKSGLFNLLKKGELDTSPVFMFEEKGYMASAEKSIERGLGENMKNHLYVVATMYESPVPDCPEGIKNEDFRANDPWNSMAEMLKSVGVKKIRASGAFLDMRYANIPMDGCLGNAIKNLSVHFDIEITEFAYPQRGADRKEGSIILKSTN
jgi:hypothetical protein